MARAATSVAIRHDGKQVAVGLQDGAIFVFSTAPSDDGTAELSGQDDTKRIALKKNEPAFGESGGRMM